MPGSILEAAVASPARRHDDVGQSQVVRIPSTPLLTTARFVTALLICGPVIGLAVLVPLGLGRALSPWAWITAVVLYGFTGFGVTTGFHRLLTHRAFKTNRLLKVVLAVAGSMALEGSVIGWVATHRRHHRFGDRPGDPHSPHRYGSGFFGITRGFLYAQVAWLFSTDTTEAERFAPDLLRDRDLVIVDRLFPVLALTSLTLPFGIGWLAYRTLAGAVIVFLWAGLARMLLLHHVTWSINSACHLWGRRPFATSDLSTNLAPLALISFGESWHNFHHAAPASARHGVLRWQFDPSARLIRIFELAGWATKVRWPTAEQIATLSSQEPHGRPVRRVQPRGVRPDLEPLSL